MNRRMIVGLVFLAGVVMVVGAEVEAENIDPGGTGAAYAWGENVGWLNFDAAYGPGVTVSETEVTGYVWAENIGWINLFPASYGGVANDGAGNLSGFAWGENVGWINFNPQVSGDPSHYGVRIDLAGNFDGWAWGENIGWISFDSARPSNVVVCRVGLADLAALADDWLMSGAVPGNLDGDDFVGLGDFGILAGYWLSYCPDGWPLE